MQTPAVLALSVLVSAGAGAAAAVLLAPEAPIAPATAGLESQLAELQRAHAVLQQELAALRTAAPAAVAAPATAERTAASLPAEAVAAAVEAYLRQRGGSAADAVAGAPTFDIEHDFAALGETDFWSKPDLWKRAFAAGKMDEVIARYEALAKADPKNVEAKMDLAKACIAYMQMDPTRWQLSMKADRAYDDVLDLDETHWEARFSKAVGYTFWPEFLGKKKAAVEHFEILVQQQELQPPTDSQAQTYLYLGNLLEEKEPERAREVWRRGAARHPGNAELRQKAGN